MSPFPPGGLRSVGWSSTGGEPGHGPRRRLVRRVVESYLDCGRCLGGFARLRCASCHKPSLTTKRYKLPLGFPEVPHGR